MLDQRQLGELDDLITRVVAAENNVKLAVIFGPLAKPAAGVSADRVVMVDCYQAKPSKVRSLQRRINNQTEHEVDVLTVATLRSRVPMELRRAVITGRPVKDNGGEWDQLQSERGAIVAGGDQQQARVEGLFADELQRRGILT